MVKVFRILVKRIFLLKIGLVFLLVTLLNVKGGVDKMSNPLSTTYPLNMTYPFKLPEMGYKYDALEPYIDALTMEIHYTKHHGGYVNNLNSAIEKYSYLHSYSVQELLMNLNSLPEDIRESVRNNGGGHLNHTIWWQILTPGGSKTPVGELANEITKNFGNFENFKELFNKAAMSRFGSGWAWLVMDNFGKLHIISTPNQDNPIMQNMWPIFGIDVWEHSYYLKYQNRRADYLNAVWNVLNWDVIEQRYQNIKSKVNSFKNLW